MNTFALFFLEWPVVLAMGGTLFFLMVSCAVAYQMGFRNGCNYALGEVERAMGDSPIAKITNPGEPNE